MKKHLEKIDYLSKILSFLVNAKNLIIAITSIALLTLSLFYVARTSVDNKISIEFLPVPNKLMELGYSDLILGQMYLDDIQYISKTANTTAIRKECVSKNNEISLGIPFFEKDISVGNAKSFLQNVFNIKSNSITGFIRFISNDSLVLTTRFNSNLSVIIKGKTNELEKLIRLSVEKQFKYFDPYILASYFETINSDTTSVDIIKYIISMPPLDDDKWAYNLWGSLLMKHEWNKEAEQKLKKSLSVDSMFFLPYYNLGLISFYNSNYNEALRYFKKSLLLSKNKFDLPLTEIAVIQFFRENYAEANKYVDNALKKNPSNGYSYYIKSQIYLKQKDTSKAIECVDKAIDIEINKNAYKKNNNSSQTNSLIGQFFSAKSHIYISKKDTIKAIDLLNIAIKYDSTEVSYFTILASIYLLQKKYKIAEQSYSKAYNLDPTDQLKKLYKLALRLNGNESKINSILNNQVLLKAKQSKLKEILTQ